MNTDTPNILLERAKKLRKEVNNSMFLRMLIMLIPFLVYSISLHCKQPIQNIAGQEWKCANCRTYQWQDSSNKDWQGQYKCTKCGAKR